MKARILTMTIVVGILLASPAAALTGNDLADHCNLELSEDQIFCLAYVAGVYDAHIELERSGYLTTGSTICRPDKATYKQMGKIFMGYIDSHPEQLHLTASILVLVSLQEAWPCSE